MSVVEPAREKIVRQLQEAVERLQEDIACVELWTVALGGFSQPIPDYDQANTKLNQFLLPRSAADGSASEPRDDLARGSNPVRKNTSAQRRSGA